ncbi:NAD-dependent epimerase/dehydratase family protein [Puniceibacterium sediminis]|uniref:UDP-glucose 4-epimerase n=1 Tax=Puniceibacterium sediminis TaxID=1608407 RepID=A0A238X3F5_9RHOB|nr:NAD(P)-dependent oxidoreductase [Puniceibacterium sediminis]SNR53516.1 UDP-glucose 4-epimerase [Puniceibacterium sediminis]
MAKENNRVLVTGAGGFIGRHLVRALMDRGTPVIATDVGVLPPAAGVESYSADIRDTLRHAPAMARCGAVIHCGGISGPMLLADNPAEVIDINVRGTTGLLSLARDFGLRRFVGLSSVSTYGFTPDGGRPPVTEEAPLSASNAYGTSKAAADLILQSFATQHGLSATALRAGWVYGPGRVTDALIQPVVRSAHGERYELSEGGDHLLQFVHVADVVQAILLALDAKTLPSPAYNIDGDEVLTVREIVRLIAALAPGTSASVGPGLLPGTEVQGRIETDKARRELGWAPAIPFGSGLADYVEWLKEHPY